MSGPRRLAHEVVLLPEQSESEFQATVLKLLKLHGWPPELTYHTHRSDRSTAGFPDLVAVKPSDGRLLIVELKKQSGTLSPEQRAWMDALGTVRHFDAKVWRPSDLEDVAKFIR